MDKIILYGTALLAVALTLAFLSLEGGVGLVTSGGLVLLAFLIAAVGVVIVNILRRKF